MLFFVCHLVLVLTTQLGALQSEFPLPFLTGMLGQIISFDVDVVFVFGIVVAESIVRHLALIFFVGVHVVTQDCQLDIVGPILLRHNQSTILNIFVFRYLLSMSI